MNKFYKLLPKASKEAGVLYAPDDWPYPIAEDGRPVDNWNENLVLELREGKYCPFDMCVGGANVVDEELKELFRSYLGDEPNVEFLPVKAESLEYGDRMYYIIHFKQIYSDTIDKKHSDFLNGRVARYGLSYDKVKDLKVFTARGDDVLVCQEIAAEMKKRKLDFGTELFPIRCFKEGE